MVQLTDVRKTVEIILPSFPESKIVLYEGLLFGQMKELEKAKTDTERGLITLKLLIKNWNFTDEKKEKLPVNEESLNLLPLKDLTFLMKKVGVFFTQLNKEIGKL